MSSKFGLPIKWATLSFEPVKKLSRQITWSPRSTRNVHRCDPTKPAPPVTRTRLESTRGLALMRGGAGGWGGKWGGGRRGRGAAPSRSRWRHGIAHGRVGGRTARHGGRRPRRRRGAQRGPRGGAFRGRAVPWPAPAMQDAARQCLETARAGGAPPRTSAGAPAPARKPPARSGPPRARCRWRSPWWAGGGRAVMRGRGRPERKCERVTRAALPTLPPAPRASAS